MKERIWIPRELEQLAEARRRRVCALQPKWGKCSHRCCRELWDATWETMSEAERAVLFPLGAQTEAKSA